MAYSLRTHIREIGLVNALIEAFDSALQKVSARFGAPRYLLFAQPIYSEPLLSRPPTGFNIKEIKRDDPVLARVPRSAEELNERFSAGATCLGALNASNGELLGFIWLLFGPYREPEDRCLLRPPDAPPCALDIDIYIYPQARSGLLFAQLWDAARVLLYKRGIQWTLSRISAFNPQSVRAHHRLGAQKVATLQYLKFGRFELLLTSCPPYISWSTDALRIPEITIPVPTSQLKKSSEESPP